MCVSLVLYEINLCKTIYTGLVSDPCCEYQVIELKVTLLLSDSEHQISIDGAYVSLKKKIGISQLFLQAR